MASRGGEKREAVAGVPVEPSRVKPNPRGETAKEARIRTDERNVTSRTREDRVQNVRAGGGWGAYRKE